ncbi:Peroxyureidoacrylate/ureidoacrylate amidohydrolase RutB [Cyphellophora attinorum]|uniref:Peroxyureidoacrylate/ureidoacrylate amidohydrolase RutB n=1 Tax=Cyphellophora attinorum TaxID=1664694 RepID=A0A0N1NY76_9EURO|nr:Peroxyureidoacrylate/ureidoacrylate amidohydrolase RutB [Phialophora attinorum]KPI39325.1 Peroxyureidoacrylate/ureidoacrylate amidohydrolase RutB [Phialophora attinorum]
MNTTDSSHRKGIVGTAESFWLYDSETGFDLTHPATPDAEPLQPRYTIRTTTLPITVHPPHSALVIIDMQNFFLSPQLGRPSDSKGLKAQQQLLKYAIPAARKAGIRIIWCNWGLTDDDMKLMNPATFRAFGFETVPAEDFGRYHEIQPKEAAIDSHGVNEAAPAISKAKVETGGKNPRIYKGLGSDIGDVEIEDGSTVPGGRLLFRNTWNAGLTPELDAAYREGLKANPPDVWMHKDRMSGLWHPKTQCAEFLKKDGIRTLFFTGVNTDQCVGGSLQDAFTTGFDCVLLSDGAATTSPDSSQESIVFNCEKTWGFATTCQRFAEGVGA